MAIMKRKYISIKTLKRTRRYKGRDKSKKIWDRANSIMLNPKHAIRPSMKVQSILIPRENYTKKEADAWIRRYEKKNNIKHKKEETTERYFRYRIRAPNVFDPKSFRTIEFQNTDGIKAIVGRFRFEGKAKGARKLHNPSHSESYWWEKYRKTEYITPYTFKGRSIPAAYISDLSGDSHSMDVDAKNATVMHNLLTEEMRNDFRIFPRTLFALKWYYIITKYIYGATPLLQNYYKRISERIWAAAHKYKYSRDYKYVTGFYIMLYEKMMKYMNKLEAQANHSSIHHKANWMAFIFSNANMRNSHRSRNDRPPLQYPYPVKLWYFTFKDGMLYFNNMLSEDSEYSQYLQGRDIELDRKYAKLYMSLILAIDPDEYSVDAGKTLYELFVTDPFFSLHDAAEALELYQEYRHDTEPLSASQLMTAFGREDFVEFFEKSVQAIEDVYGLHL